jgi:hypothetical protein
MCRLWIFWKLGQFLKGLLKVLQALNVNMKPIFSSVLEALSGVNASSKFSNITTFISITLSGSLFGTVCERTPVPPVPTKKSNTNTCINSKEYPLLNWGTILYRLNSRVPLVWGLFLDLTHFTSSFLDLKASAKACSNPIVDASIQVLPKTGMRPSSGSLTMFY